MNIAGQGRLKDPAVLEQQVRRMLKDPRAEALAVNFAGQWLNLRGLQARARCRCCIRISTIRCARRCAAKSSCSSTTSSAKTAVTELLTADYTFVNERLAKHYGIPNIYGSQFRRVTLPARYGRCAKA